MLDAVFIFPVFIAGIVTFLAPCTFPLIPAYLGFLAGAKGLPHEAHFTARLRMVWVAWWYVLGFSLVFIFFGASIGLFGAAFADARVWLERIGGVIAISFGALILFGKDDLIFRGPLFRIKSIPQKAASPITAFMLGVSFGAGWTPCVGPILGSVLTLAAASATAASGVLLLTVYSIGLAIPFLLLAFIFDRITQYSHKILGYLTVLRKASGVIFIALGLLLVSGKAAFLAKWGYDLFDALNINWRILFNFF